MENNNPKKVVETALAIGLSTSALFGVMPSRVEAHYNPSKHPNIERIKNGAIRTFDYTKKKTEQGIDYVKKKHDDYEYKQYQKNKLRDLREQNRRN